MTDDDLYLVGAVVLLVFAMTRRASASTGRSSSFYALAEAIAAAEGYGIPGAIPTLRNNPGDLILGGAGVTTFASADDGWNALYNQLDLIRDGGSSFYTPAMTLTQFSRVWTTTQQGAWLSNVIAGLAARGIAASDATTLGELL